LSVPDHRMTDTNRSNAMFSYRYVDADVLPVWEVRGELVGISDTSAAAADG